MIAAQLQRWPLTPRLSQRERRVFLALPLEQRRLQEGDRSPSEGAMLSGFAVSKYRKKYVGQPEAYSSIGKLTENVAPLLCSLLRVTAPRNSFTIRSTMESPSPGPLIFVV